jgi:Putative adhesin
MEAPVSEDLATRPLPPSPPPTGRGAGRAVAVLLAVFGLLLALTGALALVAQAITDSDTTIRTFTGVRRLVVEAGSGDLTITGSGREDVRAELRRRWSWRRPTLQGRLEDGVLHLDGGCRGAFLGSCDVHWRIQAPAGIPLVVRTGSANVTAEGMRAGIDLRTRSGDVRGTSIAGPVLLRTYSGRAQVRDVTGDVAATSTSGDVSATGVVGRRIEVRTSSGDAGVQAAVPAPELVVAHTSSGDVTVVVPDEAYRVETRTGSGDVDVSEVRQAPDAPRRIQATTGSGSITVRRS